jgi:hypothetical protein
VNIKISKGGLNMKNIRMVSKVITGIISGTLILSSSSMAFASSYDNGNPNMDNTYYKLVKIGQKGNFEKNYISSTNGGALTLDEADLSLVDVRDMLDDEVAAGNITHTQEDDILDYFDIYDSETIAEVFDRLVSDEVIAKVQASALKFIIYSNRAISNKTNSLADVTFSECGLSIVDVEDLLNKEVAVGNITRTQKNRLLSYFSGYKSESIDDIFYELINDEVLAKTQADGLELLILGEINNTYIETATVKSILSKFGISLDDVGYLLYEQFSDGNITSAQVKIMSDYFQDYKSLTIEEIFQTLVSNNVITKTQANTLKSVILSNLQDSYQVPSNQNTNNKNNRSKQSLERYISDRNTTQGTFNTIRNWDIDEIEKLLNEQVASKGITRTEKNDILEYFENNESETISAIFDKLVKDYVFTRYKAETIETTILKGLRKSR